MMRRLHGFTAVGVLCTVAGCGGAEEGSAIPPTNGDVSSHEATLVARRPRVPKGGSTSSSSSSASSSSGSTMTGGSGGAGGHGASASSSGSTGSGASTSTGTSTGSGASTGTGGTSTSSGSSGGPSAGSCLASTLLANLGVGHVLVGASMTGATASSSHFDGRYQYISGGIFDGSAPCNSCAAGCTAGGQTCANSGPGCGWWGCWQSDQQAPGQFLMGFDSASKSAGQLPMITYYQALQASGVAEGAAEVLVMSDAVFLARYLADYRFVLQKIGADKALVHLEPDFWGYAQHVNANPHAIPAAVATANPADCAGQENSIAGLGRCMIAMARKYAPHAQVGLHASGWAASTDVMANADPTLDVAAEAAKVAGFLVAAGAAGGDFIAADMSDRDAGWYQAHGRNSWLDDTNQKLPTFHQAFAWGKAVAETAGKPMIWWQVPVGNMAMGNAGQQWKDNRVDYLFAHMNEVAAAHGAGVFFGAGDGAQTTPETDGGHLVAKAAAYAAGGGQPACP